MEIDGWHWRTGLPVRTIQFVARALVNRIWFHLFGRGIVEPPDDFRDSNPASNDELLDALAREFVAHGYDAKHIIRLILNSRTYQLSAQTNDRNQEDNKYFSHCYPKLLPAEVLLDAISQATGVPERFAGLPPGTRAVQLPDGEVNHVFLKTFGQPARELACECERESESNLAQALQLINGPTIHQKLREPNNRIGQLLAKNLSPQQIVEELYLSTLSPPTGTFRGPGCSPACPEQLRQTSSLGRCALGLAQRQGIPLPALIELAPDAEIPRLTTGFDWRCWSVSWQLEDGPPGPRPGFPRQTGRGIWAK
jgi:hypothetical protein